MSERLSDQEFEALEAKHGDLVEIDTVLGACVFKRPSRADYKRYLDYIFDERKRSSAQEILVRSCCVSPSKEAFDKMLDDAPGIATSCSSEVLKLAGQAIETEVLRRTRKN